MMNNKEKKNVIGTTAGVKSAESYSQMAKGLNSLNTGRGGEKGLKGFAFEEMHAADVRVKGHSCNVVNNNGAADLIVDGMPVQLKMGYHNNQPKWRAGYEKVVVDKGNMQLAQKAGKAGYAVEESAVSNAEAKAVADAMRLESTITKSTTAPITGTMSSAHFAGKTAAGVTAKVFVPLQAGANLYDVVAGNKEIEDAVADTVVDGAVAVGTTYLGTAALTAAGTAVSAAGAAAAETAVGAAAITAATSASAALAGTAVGGAAAAAVGTAGTAIAAVAAAPVLPAVAIATGIGFALGAVFDLFD